MGPGSKEISSIDDLGLRWRISGLGPALARVGVAPQDIPISTSTRRRARHDDAAEFICLTTTRSSACPR
jgi:TRAP-type mannitol/chloroaromatic compound transport system substrate-binding protein